MPDPAAAEEQYLKKKKANTFKERRKEGRTMHTRLSAAAISCGFIGFLSNALALVMPSWRASYIGLLGYGHRRYWGFFKVDGLKSQWHWDVMNDTCEWWTRLMLGNTCLSPICKWYQLKCFMYWDLMAYSIGFGFLAFIVVLLQLFCLVSTLKFDTRSIAWAANWWCVVAFLHTVVIFGYQIAVQMVFDELDLKAWYPLPYPGAAAFLSFLGFILLWVNTVMGWRLRAMWPEVDPDDPDQFASSDDDDDDDDDSSDDSAPRRKKPKGGAAASSAAASGGRQWFYKDKSDQQQGPFPTAQILDWHGKGAFQPETMFRASNESDFTPLGDGSRLKA